MWFDDGEMTGRRWSRKNRRRRAPRHPILAVNTRLNAQRDQEVRRIAWIVLALLVLTAATAFGYFGYAQTWELLFANNPNFTIRTLDIRTEPGAVITPTLVREYTGLEEGANLFAVDIARIRRDIMARVPNVRDMEITRRLPGALRIEVYERIPIAAIQQKRGPDVFVDEQGYVFAARVRREGLTLITGCDGPVLRLGQRVEGLLMDAVLTRDTSAKIPAALELEIVEIDVRGKLEGRDDALRLRLASGTAVSFWWPRPEDDATCGLQALQDRLTFLAAVLRWHRRNGRPFPPTFSLTRNSITGTGAFE
ncbi:MAG: FtsQ-type POTRA domain-containing protein [Verrucomicrobiota bacterium]|nr:FtsQ-type POTRA domain-containing protein [Verrucomicrobiota bacterium]